MWLNWTWRESEKKKYKALLSAKSCRMHLFHVPPVVRINEFSTSHVSLNMLIFILRALSVQYLCSILATKLMKKIVLCQNWHRKLLMDIMSEWIYFPIGISRSHWTPKNSKNQCNCGKKFSLKVRSHHCRRLVNYKFDCNWYIISLSMFVCLNFAYRGLTKVKEIDNITWIRRFSDEH